MGSTAMVRSVLLAAALSMSPVSGHAQKDVDKVQLDALAKAMDSAPANQRLAYNVLFVAFNTFRDAHLRHETCMAGTDCRELQRAEGHRLEDGYLKLAQGFAPEKPPAFTAEDLIAYDAALNALYERLLASLPESCPATQALCLSQGTFREVQRDWIRYRDAAVTFGTLRLPQIAAQDWQTYLTVQRIEQLRAAFGLVEM